MSVEGSAKLRTAAEDVPAAGVEGDVAGLGRDVGGSLVAGASGVVAPPSGSGLVLPYDPQQLLDAQRDSAVQMAASAATSLAAAALGYEGAVPVLPIRFPGSTFAPDGAVDKTVQDSDVAGALLALTGLASGASASTPSPSNLSLGVSTTEGSCIAVVACCYCCC